MRRRSGRLYVAALAITVIVFALGVLLGMVIEEQRLRYVESRYAKDRINYESLQLQYLYITTLADEKQCSAFSATLNSYLKRLEETRARLEGYAKDEGTRSDEFVELKRQYVIAQLNYWLLARKTTETCDADTQSILFFYSKDCSECKSQGYVLDYLKMVFGDRLLIFAIETDFEEEPMIGILSDTFDVDINPTLIVKNQKLEGFIPKDELINLVCSQYKQPPEECNE